MGSHARSPAGRRRIATHVTASTAGVADRASPTAASTLLATVARYRSFLRASDLARIVVRPAVVRAGSVSAITSSTSGQVTASTATRSTNPSTLATARGNAARSVATTAS